MEFLSRSEVEKTSYSSLLGRVFSTWLISSISSPSEIPNFSIARKRAILSIMYLGLGIEKSFKPPDQVIFWSLD